MTTNFENISVDNAKLNLNELDQIVGGSGKEPYSDVYIRPATITEKLKAAGVLD